MNRTSAITMASVVGLAFCSALLLTFASCGGGSGSSTATTDSTEVTNAEGLATGGGEVKGYYFALSNENGSQFLSKLSPESDYFDMVDKTGFAYAIYEGKAYRIEYSGYQEENKEKNNHRDTYFNFDNLCGLLYKNLDGVLPTPDGAVYGTVMLVNPSFSDENPLVSCEYIARDSELADGMNNASLITAEKKKFNRKVKRTRVVLALGEGGQNHFYSVQLENKGDEAMGLYVLETGAGYAIAEFPATADDYSTWRVDDEGEFFPPTIIAALKGENGYTFAIDDAGPEGVDTFLMRQSGDKLIKSSDDLQYSRYTAPC